MKKNMLRKLVAIFIDVFFVWEVVHVMWDVMCF